jgi:hypothetical protein
MAGLEMPAGVVFGSPASNSGVEAVARRNEQLLLPQSNFSRQHIAIFPIRNFEESVSADVSHTDS